MALTDGILAYYKLDETSGTSAADSASTNTGTLTNGPTWAAGKINNGISLASASSQYIDLGTGLNPAAITYTAWIKATSFANSYNAVVTRSGGGNHFSALLIKSTGKLAIYMGNGSGFVDYDGTGTNTLSTATWYFLATTYDSTNGLKGYVNGSLDGSAAANGTLTVDAASTRIGDDPVTNPRYFNGLIDEVGIWNRALTSTEITQLYNSGSGLQYPFGASSTTSLFRQSLLNGLGSGGPFFNNPLGRSMIGWVPKLVTA